MGTPNVQLTKLDFQTGVVGPSPLGIMAILAPCGDTTNATLNVPQKFARDVDIASTYKQGRLTELASYILQTGKNPVIAQRTGSSIAAVYGAVDVTGSPTGTSTPTAGATAPVDNYDVIITWVTGGTMGAAGITYTYSLDGGLTTSAPVALGTGATPIVLTIPAFSLGGSPGVSFSLAAGNVVAGEFFRCLTRTAQMNDTDLTTALAALKTAAQPWEGVLIDEDAASTTPGLVDTWLSGLELLGKFRFAVLNTRMKNQAHVGTGTAETESAYTTAMTTLTAAMSTSIRLCIGTDGATSSSTLTGRTLPRPTSMFLVGRAALIPIGEDPAFVGRGPLPNCTIVDGGANPAFHNEENFQNLDPLHLTAIRGLQGAPTPYINNANVFSVTGSDFVYLQHVRVMNRACEIAFALLLQALGIGVGTKPKDATTGAVYILEGDAQVIEGRVNAVLAAQLGSAVQGVKFALSRTDDLSSNAGATLTGLMQVAALRYVKQFKVNTAFAKAIAA